MGYQQLSVKFFPLFKVQLWFWLYTGYTLKQVKTANMGSLFMLTYDLRLRDPSEEKAFIDQLRRRNGNLEISISYQETAAAGL